MTTKGWADSNINIQYGCKNGCLYCYAARMAIRFKRFSSLNEWTTQTSLNYKNINKQYRKRNGRIMFPTSHDIYLENIKESIIVLSHLIKTGNKILITTKPVPEVIENICYEFDEFRDLIQFRFTITSRCNSSLKLWEPNAPAYLERTRSLVYAYSMGFKTSVSIEPYLDEYIIDLIKDIEPYITESIWIGVMNYSMLPKEGWELYHRKNMKRLYSKEFIEKNLENWKKAANGKLRLKDSIRNILGK